MICFHEQDVDTKFLFGWSVKTKQKMVILKNIQNWRYFTNPDAILIVLTNVNNSITLKLEKFLILLLHLKWFNEKLAKISLSFSGFTHCYDFKEDDRYFYLLCSYHKGELVRDLVAKSFPQWSWQRIINFTFRFIITVSERISVLHSLGFCHDFLNPENFLLDENNNLPLLIDFEHVKQYRQGWVNNSNIWVKDLKNKKRRSPTAIISVNVAHKKIERTCNKSH